MSFSWFRRRTPEPQVPLDTRKVNLSDVGQSHDTLSMRIERPDQYRPLDPVMAVDAADEATTATETLNLVEAAAPVVDEFIADVLNGWLDEHLPGWHARTDAETLRRLDLQRVLIAEITQNYALVNVRLVHQRRRVAALQDVVDRADAVLSGTGAPPPVDAGPGALPDPAAFGHPDLSAPVRTPGLMVVPSTPEQGVA
ncbi:hypothetical protein SAMN04489835_1097 [Mycolicibacterium rutilum]|uniref:Uncharacterized protein n=2 Tax=Mycolicibacterium rutilum TaxID=370526 RepID=A0A1H6IZZ8_MYCRU|nr:hypothetical protein SAMN04489835_1097 [Mycolicibacterium rutilum]